MTPFLKWLRVELLRLRSLHWNHGSTSIKELKDGVLKFNAFYRMSDLSKKLEMTEDEILRAIDSPPVVAELEEKSFTAHWKDGTIILAWLEEGIQDWKMEFTENFYEEGGSFYKRFRWLTRIVYLDGTDRIVNDSGEPVPTKVSKEEFDGAIERVVKLDAKQEQAANRLRSMLRNGDPKL